MICVVCAAAVVAAEAVTASAVITNCEENDEGDYDEPKYFVVKNITETIHITLFPAKSRRSPFIFSEEVFRPLLSCYA